jgi:signal peptidase I
MPGFDLFLCLPLAQHGSEPSSMMVLVDKLARTPLSQIVIFAAVLTGLRLIVHPLLIKTPRHRQGPAFSIGRFVNDVSDALIYAAVLVFLLVRPFGIQTFWIPSGSMVDTLLINDLLILNKFVYRVSDPKDGDIVVFEPPKEAPDGATGNVDFIKRLIGQPGDLIEIKDRVFFRNGVKQEEPYVEFTSMASSYLQPLPAAERKTALYPDFKLVEVDGKVIPLLINAEGEANYGIYESGQGLTEYSGIFRASSQEQAKEWAGLPAAKVPAGHYLFMGDNRNGSNDGRFWGLVQRDKIVGRSEVIWLPMSRWRMTR